MRDREAPSSRVESPEEAFSVLGDETRLSILLELTRVAGESGADTRVPFSELRQRVGIADSGQFNYHLAQLTDEFVTKDDDGYRARYPGLQVVSTIYAGLYSEPDSSTGESEYRCPRCERRVEIAYQDLSLTLRCDEHGPMVEYPVPPGAFDGRTLQEVTTVVLNRAMTELESGTAGICQRCWGTVELEWPVDPPEVGTGTSADDQLWVSVACDRCWLRYELPYRAVVAAHPAVRGFYTDNGHDQLAALIGPVSTTAEGVCALTVHDDRRVTATIELEDTLSVTLDEEFTLLERTTGRSG